ncbi:MAG: hypothetical protein R6V60_05755 [Desulfobacterales bacterium]
MKKSLGAKALVFPTTVWIVGTYDKDGRPNGMPDIEKVAPIIFGPEIRTYHGIGRYLGRAFEIGKKI